MRGVSAEKNRTFPYFGEMAALFSVATLSGLCLALSSPEGSVAVVQAVLSEFAYLNELRPWELAVFIFLNNSLKALAVMLLGVGFALVPLVFLFLNGQFLGLVVGVIGSVHGYALVFSALALHGVLEIPALLVAAGWGVFLGKSLYLKIRYGQHLGPHFRQALKTFWKVVLPVLAAAAVVEVYISPLLLRWGN